GPSASRRRAELRHEAPPRTVQPRSEKQRSTRAARSWRPPFATSRRAGISLLVVGKRQPASSLPGAAVAPRDNAERDQDESKHEQAKRDLGVEGQSGRAHDVAQSHRSPPFEAVARFGLALANFSPEAPGLGSVFLMSVPRRCR